jgi:hypothetical protein
VSENKPRANVLAVIAFAIIVIVAIILFLTNGSLLKNGNNPNAQFSVSVDLPPDVSNYLLITHACEWEGGGNTITCQGLIQNTNSSATVESNDGITLDVFSIKTSCLICTKKTGHFRLEGGKQTPYSVSCTINPKQDVKVSITMGFRTVACCGPGINCGSPPGGVGGIIQCQAGFAYDARTGQCVAS